MVNLSFWEKTTFFGNVDIAIIGSGLVGLNAALTLKSLRPNLKIIILERGTLPSGASTKNAGFACFGSPSELLDDLENQSEANVFGLVEQRWDGLRRLLDTIGDIDLEFEQYGGHELFMEKDIETYKKCVDALPYLNENLKRIIPIHQNYKVIKRDKFGFKGLDRQIQIQAEGQINTGKMMQRLINIASEKDIKIYNGITIQNLEEHSTHVEIQTENNWTIKTQKVIVATNGFTQKILPHLEVTPARNQVLITKPIDNLLIEGTFHLDKGYYYFRNVGNRILFGGGRNLDIKGETTTEFGTTDLIQKNLMSILKTHILPNSNFEIEQWWSGILGVGHSKKPIVQKVSKNIIVAVRLGGMGVAIGSLIGEEGAKMCLA
jgi:gamma-glutamylputrescine oxidase